MDIRSLLEDFNPGKFFAYLCVILFTYFLGLKLDDGIHWNYWVIFLPLWIYNFVVILGAFVGTIVWYLNPHYRTDFESYTQYITMIVTSILHILLFIFEILICDQLQNHNSYWIFVFIPLLFASIISIPLCIWFFHKNKSFELPFLCGINCLQFILVAVKLDNFINWSWMMILLPSWILESLSILGITIIIILTFTFIRDAQVIHLVRKNIFSAAIYLLVFIPIIIFQILLINKLDHDSSAKYTYIMLPLIVSLILMLWLSFDSKPQNPWWFGLHKDVSSLFFEAFPMLREYLNVSYDCKESCVDDVNSDGSSMADFEAGDIPNNNYQLNYYPDRPLDSFRQLLPTNSSAVGNLVMPPVYSTELPNTSLTWRPSPSLPFNNSGNMENSPNPVKSIEIIDIKDSLNISNQTLSNNAAGFLPSTSNSVELNELIKIEPVSSYQPLAEMTQNISNQGSVKKKFRLNTAALWPNFKKSNNNKDHEELKRFTNVDKAFSHTLYSNKTQPYKCLYLPD